LLLMPNSLFRDKYEKSKLYRELVIEMKDIDPDTNQPAKVIIKLAMLQPSVTEIKKSDKEVKIGMSNQGFYLMRHDRQIGRALTLSIYTRNAHMNFLRAEISFPACLDQYFGIQTNKSRFSLKEGLKDLILENMKGIISQMQSEFDAERTKYKNMLEKHKVKESERIAAQASKVMKKPEFDLPEEEITKNKQKRKKEKDEDIKRVELDMSLKEEEKVIIKKEIENEFQTRMPFKVKLKHVETGDFYIVHPIGNNEVEIFLNTAHPFFNKIYEKAQERDMAKYLDLMLFTLAKGEMDFWHVEEIKQFYNQQKSIWSTFLTTFLNYSN